MGSHELYSTAWSYDAADNGGLDGFVVPLPTSLSGVGAGQAGSEASSSRASSYVSASHAQMYALEDGRHVVLRILEPGNALQLRDITSNACITFQLPGSSRTGSIIPECSVSLCRTSKTTSLQIILLANLGAGLVAYRLLLSDAELQNPEALPVDSKNAASWCTEQQVLPSHVISRSSPVLVHALDRSHLAYDTLALAFSDGTLLKLEWIPEDGRFHESALSRQQSFLSSVRSLFPGRFGSQSNLAAIASSSSPSRNSPVTSSAEQVVSMASLSSTCLYTISRDRKLRIWSIPSNVCLETIQLPANPTTMEIVPSTSSNGFERENSESPSLLPSTPMPLIRLFNANKQSALQQDLLIHVPSHQVQTSFFILYTLTFDDKGRLLSISPVLEKPCDFAMDAPSSTSYLGDFRVLPGSEGQQILWTLWNEGGQTVIRYSNLEMSPSGEPLALSDPNETMASIFPPLLDTWHLVTLSSHQMNHSLDIPSTAFDRAHVALRSELDSANLSTPEMAHQVTICAKEACIDSFIEHLFHPGRYPTAAALLSYIKTLSRQTAPGSSALRIPSRTDSSTSLAQQLLDVVGFQLTLQEDPMTGALKEDEYIKAYKLELMKVLALAEDNKRSAKQPLAFGVSSTEDLLVFARGAIAAPVLTPWAKALAASETTLDLSLLAPQYGPEFSTLYRLAHKTCSELQRIDAQLFASFEEAANQAVTNPVSSALEDIASGLFEDIFENVVDDNMQMAFSVAIKEIDQSRQENSNRTSDGMSPSGLAGLVTCAINSLTASKGAEGSHRKASSLFASASLAGLVVDTSTEDVHARYHLSISLFLFALFVQYGLTEPPSSNSEDADEQDALISDEDGLEILGRAWEALKGFSLAKWLVDHNIATTDLKVEVSGVNDDSGEDLMLRLKEMRFKGSASASTAAQPESVLSKLLDCADDETVEALNRATRIDTASQAFLHRLGLLGWQEMSSLTLAPIAATLLQQGLEAESMALVSRISEREEDAALLHLQALIACRTGDVDSAIRGFDKVAAAIYADDASVAVLLKIAGAGDSNSRSVYYRSIIPELEAQQASMAVALTCLRAINAYEAEDTSDMEADERPSWLKDLWYKAFRNFASTGAYDEAYTTMMGMPSRTLQLDALRHLVAVMCEEGAGGVLLKYAFVGMQEDLEKCLSFRARNAYPLAQPDYYKILHAWQCLMNDYRGAAATMYQRASRLGAMTLQGGQAVEVLTAQCQSYLVAISVLELQSPEKRFIMIERGDKPQQPKRKKTRLMDAKLQDSAMITLEAIKREYTLTLARLQLSKDFPELTGMGHHLDSQGAVALFTQIGAFDLALQSALALGLDMSNIFGHMTLRCVAYSQGILGVSADEAWVVQDTNASGWEGSLASKAWKLLQLYLERYDVDGEYRRTVLSVILQEDRRVRLPKALVDWFMDVHPEYLIWRLVENDLLEDAFVYAHRMLEQRNTQLQRNLASIRSGAVYIPYNLLDQLLAVDLEGEVAARKTDLQEQQRKLKGAIDEQHRRMDQVLTVL